MMPSSAAGIIISLAAEWSEPSTSDWVLLAMTWVWHWAAAGIMIWGLVALLIPFWCFTALLNGSQPVFRMGSIVFSHQLVVSLVVVWSVEQSANIARAACVAAGLLMLIWTRPLLRASSCWGRPG
jgi:hypothetical protein